MSSRVVCPRCPVLLALVVSLLVSCTTPAPMMPQPQEEIAPEAATGYRRLAPVRAPAAMVVAANPYASRAGAAILERGGSAVDASITMMLVLTLVEPQSAGIGGGGFLMHFDAEGRKVETIDGRETAPAAATEDMFLDAGGQPRGFMEAFMGGLSVGVPGLLRALELAHREHGKLPWAELFAPAIALAEEGFEVSPRLHELLAADPALAAEPSTRAYFYDPEGKPWPVGTRLKNPALADTLRAIAAGGADAFYGGPIAEDIAAAVRADTRNPGRLTVEDMRAYRAVPRPAVCGPYRTWRVCSMGAPSSGGIAILQLLGVLSHFELGSMEPMSADVAHLFAEASRLAYADRDTWVADPDFVQVPVEALLDPAYLKQRAGLIRMDTTMGVAQPGAVSDARFAPSVSPELPSTTHLVAVDREGDVVSLTASIEMGFGAHLMVRGFLLNNQLTDFSFVPKGPGGEAVANRPGPLKRPRSSMAPTLVLDATGERFVLAIGSPGGGRIIDYVAQSLIYALDWGMDLQRALDLPHIVNRNGATELEAGPDFQPWIDATRAELERRGHKVEVRDLNSGLHAVRRGEGGLTGAADPRREGLPLGF